MSTHTQDVRRSSATLTPWGHALKGGLSSTLVIGAVNPLFVLQTYLSNNQGLPSLKTLWKGAIPNCVSIGPAMLIAAGTSAVATQWMSANGTLSDKQKLVSGALSAVPGGISATPLERIRDVMQLRKCTLLQACKAIKRDEGLRGFGKGYVPLVLRDLITNGALLGVMPMCEGNDGAVVVAGAAAGALTAPFNTLKTRMQATLGVGSNSTMRAAYRSLIAEEGRQKALQNLAKTAGVRAVLVGGVLYGINKVNTILSAYLPKSLHQL